jgi:hypothetical protein
MSFPKCILASVLFVLPMQQIYADAYPNSLCRLSPVDNPFSNFMETSHVNSATGVHWFSNEFNRISELATQLLRGLGILEPTESAIDLSMTMSTACNFPAPSEQESTTCDFGETLFLTNYVKADDFSVVLAKEMTLDSVQLKQTYVEYEPGEGSTTFEISASYQGRHVTVENYYDGCYWSRGNAN